MPLNSYLIGASVLLAFVALVHSALGEVLIFRVMRTAGLVPTFGGELLRERHVRILWATWHAVSVLGWGIALVLWQLANAQQAGSLEDNLLTAIAVSTLGAALLVLVGTRAKHPGWIGLMAVAVLTWLGSAA